MLKLSAMDKALLRKKLLNLRRNRNHSKESETVAVLGWNVQLKQLIDLYSPKSIAAYYPVSGEGNILPFIKEIAKKTAVSILIPKENNNNYTLVQWDPNYAKMTIGKYGILEPVENKIWKDDVDLWLVPAVGVDRLGHRIGMGKGIYDRLMVKTKGLKVAVVYEDQLIAPFKVEPWDIALDIVITPQITYRCL